MVLMPREAKALIETEAELKKAARYGKMTVRGKLTDEVILLRKKAGLPLSGPLGQLEKADSKRSAYINKDGTFKGGFKGCERYQMNVKGLAKENASKLCAYIGRRAGKIP